ncbi:hypothetical protein CTI14_20885 [Methylobacterium radiotolerans]|jgi:hypothetical protein|nr:hypothetical protein SR39_27730 [Methylobacterium radiotolerans]MBY0250536.1 hypothetical protein [Methylobacterium organophilum]PJI53997.1 hypothetical protein CTI14_20885 [Methylobacterium radiotolerans]GAN48725.1 hypothetical protein ME121_2743 [Methylobacterium sp. ME121]
MTHARDRKNTRVDESDDPVLDAVAVLQCHGYTVEPDDDFARWRIDGGDWITLSALLAMALRLGLRDGPGRAQ